MEFERRLSGLELRAEGRRLSGVVMKYGDVSPSHRERFEPGALRMADSLHLDLFHDPERAIAWAPGGGLVLANGRDALTMHAELPPIPAADRALAEIKAGRVDGLSCEFRAVRERQDAGIRVIEDAILFGIAIVKAPSYGGSRVEARRRSGRTMRARIPAEETVACECAGQDTRWARVIQPAMEKMWADSFAGGTKAVVGAYLENYGTPIASTARGTLRGRIRGVGGYEVDIDLPDSEAGRALLAAWEDSGLVVRPFIADQTSVVVDGVREVTGGRLRAFIVSSTDAREGWPPPSIIATEGEAAVDDLASASAPRLRRVPRWL